MASESLIWTLFGGGSLTSATQDTGDVVADVTSTIYGNAYIQPTYNGPTGTPYGGSSWAYLRNNGGTNSQRLEVGIADDPNSAGNSGAYDAEFYIGDIDAGTPPYGFRDVITIRATDVNGAPLTVTASPNYSFQVYYNSDGSVTIAADSSSNANNDSPYTWSKITVSGGPIGNITLDYQNQYYGSSQHIYVSDISYTTQDVAICFTRGTAIETDRGPVPVEMLQPGDRVMTRDNGPQPIRWIGSRGLSAARLARNPHLRPVRIRAGALGDGLPARDLTVSPQHRVLVRSRVAVRMFDSEEVLIAAKQLCQIDGIDLLDAAEGVEYHHFLLDRHEVVQSNGAESESLFTGPEVLKTVSPAAMREIFDIFPELRERDHCPAPARPLASGRLGRKLAVRHLRNRKPLVM